MSYQPRPAVLDHLPDNIDLRPVWTPTIAIARWRAALGRRLDRLVFGELPPPLPWGSREDFVFGDD